MEKEIKTKFVQYKARSKRKFIEFNLNFEQFKFLVTKPCWYCKDSSKLVGIDRLNPKKGYTLDNVAPCCWTCNRAKSNMTRFEFYEYRQRFNQQKYKIVEDPNSFRRFKKVPI